MNRTERIKHAGELYAQLKVLHEQVDTSEKLEPKHSLCLKAVDTSLATLRFLQAEDRLRQQLWIAIPSFLGGGLATGLVVWLGKW